MVNILTKKLTRGFTREEKIAHIKKLRLIDDMLMTKAFDGCNECSQVLLQVILNNATLRVEQTKTQYSLDSIEGRSVRLDIYAVDAAGKHYDVEIQRVSKDASVKRARYHSSMMDTYALPKGKKYDDLVDTYVIFITEKDVWGEGLPSYTAARCLIHNGRQLYDGSHILYINGEIQDDTPLGRLMSDMFCESAKDMHYKELADRVSYLKDEKGGMNIMCEFSEALIEQGREEGIEQGIEQGREEGIEQGKLKKSIEIAQNLLAMHTPIEVVVKATQLSQSEVERLAKEISCKVE